MLFFVHRPLIVFIMLLSLLLCGSSKNLPLRVESFRIYPSLSPALKSSTIPLLRYYRDDEEKEATLLENNIMATAASLDHSPLHVAAALTTNYPKTKQQAATTKIIPMASPSQKIEARKEQQKPPSKVTKFYIEDIYSLTELKSFLEEDERPVVIKFYAKWCKKCQRVGKQLDRLAMEHGDRVIKRSHGLKAGEEEVEEGAVFVDGDVRFAQIEYTPESQQFITESLKIRGTPTLQMYVGTKKLLEGGSSVSKIKKEIETIQQFLLLDGGHRELMDRAERADDGIFESIVEESFYDSPDFLNEEW